MATLQCAGRALAVGLHWGFVENRNAARQQVKSQKHANFVIASSDDGMLLGSEAKEAKRAPGKTRYAGGLLAGQLLRDAILYEEIEPGRVWVCAVRGGLPLPDMDRVTDAADAAQMLADVRAYAQTPVTLVGSHPEAALTLVSLLEQVEAPMLAASKMRAASEGERVKFYGALALICAAAGYGWWMFTGQDEDEYLDEDEVVQVEAVDDNPRDRDAKLLAEARNKMLVRPDIGVLTATWGHVIGGLPYAVGGYRPAQTECRRNVCQLQWNWRAPRFERGYLEQLPGELLPSKTPGEYMRQAQTRIPLAAMPTRKLNGVRANQLDNWAMALITAGNRIGARIDVMPAGDAINAALSERSQTIGHEGRVSVVASGWNTIRNLFAMLATEQLAPERAVFNINGANVTLQMEARYVVPRD